MRLADIIGHPAVVELIRRLIERDRLPHALLLEGTLGCGRRSVAIAAAQALLCSQPVRGDACGHCNSCRLLSEQTHPDCTVLPHDSEMSDIPIDVIREQVTDQAYTSPLVSQRRVFIIPGIERLHAAAANTLLKVLEEPPAGTFIFMTTTSEAGVLRTIRSRAQLYRLSPLSHAAIHAIHERRIKSAGENMRAPAHEKNSPTGALPEHHAPLDDMNTLCRHGLQSRLVADILAQLPQKIRDDSGRTLAGEQRHTLIGWFDLFLQQLRGELRLAPERSEETCDIIERVLRLQHDLQRHLPPHVVVEGLALPTRT
jgi:DNA polymerase III subunit delta'